VTAARDALKRENKVLEAEIKGLKKKWSGKKSFDSNPHRTEALGAHLSDEKTQSVTSWCFFLAAAIAFLASAVIAQVVPTRPHEPSGSESRTLAKIIQVNVELVLVNVNVMDPEDRPVTNLQKDNFQLFEDNVEQEIVTLSHEDAPISIGIIFDTSGSMADKIERSREAALQILKTANPQDEFLLVSFAGDAKLTSGFTSNIEEFQNRMMLTKPKGPTALLDAIHLGMRQMKYARYSKRVLVVISDGGDNHSWHSESRIRKDLKEADCQLYAIGIFDKHDMKLTIEEHDGPTLLSKLANITGGRAYEVWGLDQLPVVAAKISMELRDQYVLGYRPASAPHDGSWRSIKVKVEPPTNLSSLHVYARSGYYSPKRLNTRLAYPFHDRFR
jgi:Ca-activated chloride channel family protein